MDKILVNSIACEFPGDLYVTVVRMEMQTKKCHCVISKPHQGIPDLSMRVELQSKTKTLPR